MTNKKIDTLVEDIYYVLDHTEEHEPTPDLAAQYAMRIGGEMAKSTLQRNKPRQRGKLWASDLGKPCMRQHWYNFNKPEAAEPLAGYTKFKFLYGNVLEEAALYMAEEAGHEVKHQQHTVAWDIERPGIDWTVSGRIDAVIDGTLIDVKSTSSYGFKRYKDGIDASNDSFGYLYQLGFYKAFLEVEDLNDSVGFVWIDKQNGHIKYTPCTTPDKEQLSQRAHDIIDAVEQESEQDVDRGYSAEPYGKSGNECLPMSCSYCSYKKECWKDSNGGQGLRTFAYAHKPVHFTNVVREPRALEVTDE